VTAVNELGFKSRIVTAPPAWSALLGNALRKSLWPILEDADFMDLDRLNDLTRVPGHVE